jgi:hypothetical protein
MDGTKLSRARTSVDRYEPPIGSTPSPSTRKGRGVGGRGGDGRSPRGRGRGRGSIVVGIERPGDKELLKCLAPNGGNEEMVRHFKSGVIHSGTIDGLRVITMCEQQYDDALEGYEQVKKAYLDLKEENAELLKLLSTGKRGKYKKDQYFYSIEKGLKHLLGNVMFPAMKFLPRGWDTWSDTKNTVCEILTGAIKNAPPTIHLPNYWRDVVVPYANQTYVNMRVNLNQRIKTQFCREYVSYSILS